MKWKLVPHKDSYFQIPRLEFETAFDGMFGINQSPYVGGGSGYILESKDLVFSIPQQREAFLAGLWMGINRNGTDFVNSLTMSRKRSILRDDSNPLFSVYEKGAYDAVPFYVVGQLELENPTPQDSMTNREPDKYLIKKGGTILARTGETIARLMTPVEISTYSRDWVEALRLFEVEDLHEINLSIRIAPLIKHFEEISKIEDSLQKERLSESSKPKL